MSCSRWASGGTFCRFWPISWAAMARSLSLISTPFTRATAGSDAEAGALALSFWDAASREQPTTIGRASSPRVITAKVVRRGRNAPNKGPANERNGPVIGMSLCARILSSSAVRRPPAAEAGGELRNRPFLAMVRLAADFDENVSKKRLIDKDETPPYVSIKAA